MKFVNIGYFIVGLLLLTACQQGAVGTNSPTTSASSLLDIKDWETQREANYTQWLTSNGDYEAKLTAFTKAARNAGQQLAANMGPMAEAARLKALSAKISSRDREAARKFMSQGFTLFQEGAFEAAKNRFSQGLHLNPGDAKAHYFLAETLMRLNNENTATRLNNESAAKLHYQLTTTLDPLSAEAAKAEVAASKITVGTMVRVDPHIADVPGSLMTFRDCAECPEMTAIPTGRYNMGDLTGNGNTSLSDNGFPIENPVHGVTIFRPFAVSRFEVTQAEWQAIMDTNLSEFKGNDHPVENVSWSEAKQFAKRLSDRTGKQYRLLSEAEWEYVARTGKDTDFPWGNIVSHDYANYGTENCCMGLAEGSDKWVNTAPVGSFPSNGFGLYDLNGNVWEWIEDCWNEDYIGAPEEGSANEKGMCWIHVIRGGGWADSAKDTRSSHRGGNAFERHNSYGVRIARTL